MNPQPHSFLGGCDGYQEASAGGKKLYWMPEGALLLSAALNCSTF